VTYISHALQIVSLVASKSNSAETVMNAFMKAVAAFGIPSRVRGDRGGENLKVAVYMIHCRGLNRASYMFGSSTRNTRIERLWGEVGSQLARRWRGFFLKLEREYYLDRDNPTHLWLISELFLEDIQADCDHFVQQYNHHGIRGDPKGQTPEVRTHFHFADSVCIGNRLLMSIVQDIYLIGQIEHGVYADGESDWPDVDPHLLSEHYGIDEEQLNVNPDHSGSESEGEDQDQPAPMGDAELLDLLEEGFVSNNHERTPNRGCWNHPAC
jgi:hypothetical protein